MTIYVIMEPCLGVDFALVIFNRKSGSEIIADSSSFRHTSIDFIYIHREAALGASVARF